MLFKHAESRRPSSHRTETITLSKADAKAEAEKCRAALAHAGDAAAAIAKIAAARSDCVSGQRQGQLKPFKRGELEKEFEAAAYALDKSGLSPVVETASGFHVILRVG